MFTQENSLQKRLDIIESTDLDVLTDGLEDEGKRMRWTLLLSYLQQGQIRYREALQC